MKMLKELLPKKRRVLGQVKQARKEFIQGYCNRGERPECSLNSTPLKGKVKKRKKERKRWQGFSVLG